MKRLLELQQKLKTEGLTIKEMRERDRLVEAYLEYLLKYKAVTGGVLRNIWHSEVGQDTRDLMAPYFKLVTEDPE